MTGLPLESFVHRATLVIIGLVGCLPLCLAAQVPGSLGPGERIRLQTESSSSWVIGTILAVDSDAVHLLLNETTRQVEVKRMAITRLEISHGVNSNAGSRVLKGFFIGAAVGALVGVASGDDPNGFVRFTAGDKAVILGGTGGGLGALLGLLSDSSHERWDPLSLGAARVTLMPHGASLMLSIRL
jgi:hypothetical protein